jgi:N utilization substance protein A
MSEVRVETKTGGLSGVDARRVALGVSDEIAAIPGLDANDLIALGENGIKSLNDLADLAGCELLEITGTAHLTADTANAIIMAARAHWFEDEDR